MANTFTPVATVGVLEGDNKVFSRPVFNFLNQLAATQDATFNSSNVPTSTLDKIGKIGNTAYDDNYIYIKTQIGWRRVALSSF